MAGVGWQAGELGNAIAPSSKRWCFEKLPRSSPEVVKSMVHGSADATVRMGKHFSCSVGLRALWACHLALIG